MQGVLEARQADLLPVELCSVATYVLRKTAGTFGPDQCACFTEHKFAQTIEPLVPRPQGGSTCSTSYSIVTKL